jgi:hypothetical protein
MGLFVYTQKGSIISMVDLPTTEIIEPLFLLLKSCQEVVRLDFCKPFRYDRGIWESVYSLRGSVSFDRT